MELPDMINGLIFQLGGVSVIWISIIKLWKDKEVKGISYIHVAFFTLWGFWNIFFYSYLGQWTSMIAGIILVITNSIYLYGLLKFRKGE